MVRISASGDIIHDDDTQAPIRQRTQQGPYQGQVHQGNEQPVYHMPEGTSVFETLNQKLIDAGVPSFKIGPWKIEPIVLLGFLLAFIFMGINGIIFGGLLFAVVKYSQSGAPTGGRVSDGPDDPDGPGRPGGNRRRTARWGPARWGASRPGNRLGR